MLDDNNTSSPEKMIVNHHELPEAHLPSTEDMSRRRKVREDIEILDPKDIRFGEELWLDPRDLKISPLNVRKEEPRKNLKILESSIIHEGIRDPLLVDEKKEIIDGSRRWAIALDYLLKVPVIFRSYGEGHEANEKRVLDSISSNQSEPNTDSEIGTAIDDLIRMGSEPEILANKLGVSIDQIANWAASRRSGKSFLELYAKIHYRELKKTERKQFDKIKKYRHMIPEGFATRLHIFRKLPKWARRDVEHAIQRREFIDLTWRLESAQDCEENGYVTWEFELPKTYPIWISEARKQNWDMHKTFFAVMNMFAENPDLLTQEQYERLSNPDLGMKEDEVLE